MNTTAHRVMVVEDESAIRRGILRNLSRQDLIVATGCASVEEAVGILDREIPDLLVTDLNLPGRSGLDLIAEFDRRGVRVPIVVITAHRAAYEEGLPISEDVNVLEKPFAMDELLGLVRRGLRCSTVDTGDSVFHLMDYLQLAALGKYSVTLRVEGPAGLRAEFEIVDGDIWNARAGGKSGVEAVREALGVTAGRVSTAALTQRPAARDILDTLPALLLQLAKDDDDKSRTESNTRDGVSVEDGFAAAMDAGLRAVQIEDWAAAQAAFERALDYKPGDRRAQHNLLKIEAMNAVS